MVSASKLSSERMQFDFFKITLSSAPQGGHVRDYTALHPSRSLKVVHDSGDVVVCDHLCLHESTSNAKPQYLHYSCRTFLDMNVMRTLLWTELLPA